MSSNKHNWFCSELFKMSPGLESAQCRTRYKAGRVGMFLSRKKEGRAAGIKRKKRWHGWKELEGKDICRLLTAAAVAEHPLPRRLRRANRDSCKLFTLGPCCGRLPCRASLPGVPGPRRALVGCQREDWRVESGPFSRRTRSCSVKLWWKNSRLKKTEREMPVCV